MIDYKEKAEIAQNILAINFWIKTGKKLISCVSTADRYFNQ